MPGSSEIPTSERLAAALSEAGAPAKMVDLARTGYYDDYRSPLVMPCVQLVVDLAAAARRAGSVTEAAALLALADRAKSGDFDGSRDEAAAWARSPEGRLTFAEFFGIPVDDLEG